MIDPIDWNELGLPDRPSESGFPRPEDMQSHHFNTCDGSDALTIKINSVGEGWRLLKSLTAQLEDLATDSESSLPIQFLMFGTLSEVQDDE